MAPKNTKEEKMYLRIRNVCGMLGVILPWLSLFSAGIGLGENPFQRFGRNAIGINGWVVVALLAAAVINSNQPHTWYGFCQITERV